ncbi:MAG: zf-HC2 domain-containing protein [Candidatus Omnitrophota bacterium]
MNCERIRELIATDYIDGEAEQTAISKVDEHLKGCEGCRKYKDELLESAIKPFEKAGVEVPSEKVWNSIEAAVESKEQLQNSGSIIDMLHSLLRPRQAAFAFATAAVIMIMVNIFVISPARKQGVLNAYLQEEMASLYGLNGDGSGLVSDIENAEFNTSIEMLFL